MSAVGLRKVSGLAHFVKRFCGVLSFGAALAVLGSSLPANAATPLINPSDDTMCLLYYHFANQPPPISQFAQTASSVQNADEFSQPKALADETSKLNGLYSSLATTDTVVVTLNMQFDTYDSQLGQYELTGFTDGYFVTYSCFGNTQLRLSFDNSDDASSWVLTAPQAEDVLNRNGGQRNVLVNATIKIVGVNPGAPGDPLSLVGDVRKIRVTGAYNNAPLGHYDVSSN